MTAILVIDDDFTIRDVLKKGLSMAGHEVVTASDGASGIAESRNRSFEFAFVDLGLPDAHGFEIMSCLHTRSPETHIVAMSGTLAGTLEQAPDHGATAAVRKPFSISEVIELVRAIEDNA